MAEVEEDILVEEEEESVRDDVVDDVRVEEEDVPDQEVDVHDEEGSVENQEELLGQSAERPRINHST